jgi:hypothetical protein
MGMGMGMGYHHMHNGGVGGPWWANGTTTEERIEFICDRLRQAPGHHANHMLDVHHVDDSTRDAMLAIWNRRRTEMLGCCDRDADKAGCAREMLEARFDRVCSGEEPICPWALLGRQRAAAAGTSGMSDIKERCCALDGDQRKQCFADVMDNYRRSNRYHHHGPGPMRRGGGRGRWNNGN